MYRDLPFHAGLISDCLKNSVTNAMATMKGNADKWAFRYLMFVILVATIVLLYIFLRGLGN